MFARRPRKSHSSATPGRGPKAYAGRCMRPILQPGGLNDKLNKGMASTALRNFPTDRVEPL